MRIITTAATFAAAVAVSAAVAGAQVQVTGSTQGCFGAGCTNFGSTASFGIPGTGENVSFAGMAFDGTTNPVTGGFTVGNFGTLTLVPAPAGTTPNMLFTTPFTLLFTLSAPSGSNAPTSAFTVSGFVGSTNGQGTRDIQYSAGSPASFRFTGGTGTITLDGGQINERATTISGRVTASAVPEPSTYAMMAVGLAGFVAAARRRRTMGA